MFNNITILTITENVPITSSWVGRQDGRQRQCQDTLENIKSRNEGSLATRIVQKRHQKTLGNCQRGKKEKQKNWNESGGTEICLHCTFLLTIHIHL